MIFIEMINVSVFRRRTIGLNEKKTKGLQFYKISNKDNNVTKRDPFHKNIYLLSHSTDSMAWDGLSIVRKVLKCNFEKYTKIWHFYHANSTIIHVKKSREKEREISSTAPTSSKSVWAVHKLCHMRKKKNLLEWFLFSYNFW